MSHNCSRITFSVALFFFSGLAVALGISIKYVYYDELDHSREGTCEILQCNVYESTCSYTQCQGSTSQQNCWINYYQCFNLVTELLLILYDKFGKATSYANVYTGTYNNYPDTCSYNLSLCFYDIRDIQGSLTLDSNGPLKGGIIAIVILSIALAISLVPLIISCIFCCPHFIKSCRQISCPKPKFKFCCVPKEQITPGGSTPC